MLRRNSDDTIARVQLKIDEKSRGNEQMSIRKSKIGVQGGNSKIVVFQRASQQKKGKGRKFSELQHFSGGQLQEHLGQTPQQDPEVVSENVLTRLRHERTDGGEELE